MKSRGRSSFFLLGFVILSTLFWFSRFAVAQGVSPQTGTTLFQGGSFLNFNSVFLGRDKLRIDGREAEDPQDRDVFVNVFPINWGWGFWHDNQILVSVPFVRKDLDFTGPAGDRITGLGGSGVGDILLLYKHRFLRLDRAGGTTQVAFTVGPKLPTGSNEERDQEGKLLPPSLQPGSGSTDVLFAVAGSHVVQKFTVNVSATYKLNTEGTQDVKRGNLFELRSLINYRFWQAPYPGPELWLGPIFSYEVLQRDRVNGVPALNSGGRQFFTGLFILFDPKPDWLFNFNVEFPVVQDLNGTQLGLKPRISFGVIKQLFFGS
ncbi:transporter [Acidobacteria bacterium AH-259-L09]|nr:transporter [Acidobacteria bacterium AH-259-L09]